MHVRHVRNRPPSPHLLSASLCLTLRASFPPGSNGSVVEPCISPGSIPPKSVKSAGSRAVKGSTPEEEGERDLDDFAARGRPVSLSGLANEGKT